MHSPVDQIKERLSIEEVVGSYTTLKRSGKNLRTKCPFHNERTPSFFVSPERGTYYCFGCGAKGDIFNFVQEFEGLDFSGALKLLADRAGVTLKRVSKEKQDEMERLYDMHDAATTFFQKKLAENKQAQAYLKDRGIEKETQERFQLGYAEDEWRGLYSHLRSKGFSSEEMQKAGLVAVSQKARDRYYDRFRSRIMFPITDSSGRVVAFSGRLFPDDGTMEAPKYLNSPETPLFDKGATLFGMFYAKEGIRKYDFTILAEGQTDVLLAHQCGYRNTVALLGTAMSVNEKQATHVQMMQRLSNNLVIAFDSDEAGKKAAHRNASIALSLGMDVKVACLPAGTDPADIIKDKGVSVWKDIIKDAVHIIEFQVNEIAKETQDQRKIGKAIRETVLPLVAQLPSSIEKSHFITRINDITGIPEEALREDLATVSPQEKEKEAETEEAPHHTEHSRRIVTRDALASLLFVLKEQNATLLQEAEEDLQDIRSDFSVEKLLAQYEGKPPENVLFSLESQEEEITTDLAREIIDTYLIEWLKEYLQTLSRAIKQAENKGEEENVADLLHTYHTYSQKLQSIQSRRNTYQ